MTSPRPWPVQMRAALVAATLAVGGLPAAVSAQDAAAESYRDATARRLHESAMAARERMDDDVLKYTAVVRQRIAAALRMPLKDRTLYRSAHAYHGFHPFTTWQWGAHALDHLGGVVFVGGDPKTTSRMGYKRADTVAEALQVAEPIVGSSPSITYMHIPPLFMVEVA